MKISKRRRWSVVLAFVTLGGFVAVSGFASSGSRDRESGPAVKVDSDGGSHSHASSSPAPQPGSHPASPPSSQPGSRWHGDPAHGDRSHGWHGQPGYRGWHDPRWNVGWNLGWWWGWTGYPVYVGPYDPWGYTVAYPNQRARYGALDLDVSPERAQVYIDGEYVGVADDYDGFPEYLWLEKGTYDVVLYLQGYRTIAKQITIYPGLVIDVEDKMESGESIRPENLGTTTHERRDARIRDDEQRERDAERLARPVPEEREESGREALDARGEPARVLLEVSPEDASVYLDGRFLGTGSELAHLRSRLLVDAGSHRLQVVRPGYRSEEKTFTAEAGEEQEIEIRLESD